jgi:lipoate-protein ligase A
VRSFRLLDLTLPSPADNLALDEALLDELDEYGGDPVLRLWESDRRFIVLGLSCRLADDVNLAACREDHVPILRRATGGGTVLLGPGCLSYALVLPVALDRALADIRSTNHFVLERIAKALHRWEPAIAFHGISDLAIDGFKISGNAQRRKRQALLVHGTILYAMQADVISRYLKEPSRQPEYRAGRSHATFLRTIEAPPQAIKEALADAWNARSTMDAWPAARMKDSVRMVIDRSVEDNQL